MQNDWAYAEFRSTPLWDGRCRTTLIAACQQLAEAGEMSLSRALGSRRKAVSRIVHHPDTTAADLLAGHVGATSLRCQAHPLVLVASDTTLCDFTTHKAVAGLGPLGDKEYQRGFFVHSALALTPAGVPLGVLHQQTWVRDASEPPDSADKAASDSADKAASDSADKAARAKQRRKRPFADKESHKWLDALRGVEAALPASQNALLLQDREADIFDFFAAPRRATLHLLIRATQPRCIEVDTQPRCIEVDTQPRCIEVDTPDTPHTLLEVAAQAPIVASKTVLVHARPDRDAREAILTLRLVRVAIRPPRNRPGVQAASVGMWVVRACEESPPAGVKEPITWVLLTTLPDVDAALALHLVDYYALRWRIERFHYVLKSGCGYEKLQCDTLAALHKALSVYSIVAWRLLFLMYLAREQPDTPAEAVLSFVEKEVLQRSMGKPIHTAHEAMLAVAKLAGFVAVASAPLPGVKSLWLGFRKLQDVVAGFLLARQPPPDS